MSGSPAQPYARITLVLPDGQSVEVRLYERLQTTGRFSWRFRIGVPSRVATENVMNCSECNTRLANVPACTAG
ncbi:hypothetical protein AB0H82_34830 [Streptomyces sp. NPDC050732]|uniref:hypothetical protein n=1 Tax=Streptomyces sp. NPDC050732 TaxID=3154632 RepID=UPI00342A3046